MQHYYIKYNGVYENVIIDYAWNAICVKKKTLSCITFEKAAEKTV
jgi:hypothetical protein